MVWKQYVYYVLYINFGNSVSDNADHKKKSHITNQYMTLISFDFLRMSHTPTCHTGVSGQLIKSKLCMDPYKI